MDIQLDIQHVSTIPIPVSDETLTQWVKLALHSHKNTGELSLRLVDAHEMTQLNHLYRQQNKVTNVLSFPANIPAGITLEYPPIGDIVICPSVLEQESQTFDKPLDAHWAHIVIHGVLHLVGYDHIEEADAQIMQNLETQLLLELGFTNPYLTEEDNVE